MVPRLLCVGSFKKRMLRAGDAARRNHISAHVLWCLLRSSNCDAGIMSHGVDHGQPPYIHTHSHEPWLNLLIYSLVGLY